MKFKQFQNTVYNKALGTDVARQSLAYDHIVTECVDGRILVDGSETLFSSLEEAVDSFKQQKIQDEIQQEIQTELYKEMSDNIVADIIKSRHEVKVTDTLIESYVELASSKLFTTDPVAHDIRKYNKLDQMLEGRFDYKLNDGSTIVITEQTQTRINNVFGQHQDVIEYMRESKDNFLDVLNQLEE